VIERCMDVMPERNVPYDGAMYYLLQNWFRAGGGDRCRVLALRLFDIYEREVKYLYALKRDAPSRNISGQARQAVSILQGIIQLTEQNKEAVMEKELKARFDKLAPMAQAIAPMNQQEE
jgi:hypothetical protein